MPEIVGTILKLLVASLIVGATMMWLDVDALGLLRWAGDALHGLAQNLGAIFRWAIAPLLIGATVVVPIWLIMLVVRKLKRR
jgi:hypothetical protein